MRRCGRLGECEGLNIFEEGLEVAASRMQPGTSSGLCGSAGRGCGGVDGIGAACRRKVLVDPSDLSSRYCFGAHLAVFLRCASLKFIGQPPAGG